MISIYAKISLFLWAAVFAGILITGKTAQEGVREKQQNAFWARVLKIGAMTAMFVVLYYPRALGFHIAPKTPGPTEGVVGVVLCVLGLILLVSARVALGKSWSDLVVVKEGHRVVRNGPYRWIRHPLYSGMILALLGTALIVGTRAAYTIVAACFLGFLLKARKEENLLSSQLPGYADYRRQVKGFVPYVF